MADPVRHRESGGDLMASYLETLLTQTAPLENHEANDLRRWLSVLQEDCEAFGLTAEDELRMNQIRVRIETFDHIRGAG